MPPTAPECEEPAFQEFGDDAHVVASIEAGATGYLLKDASPKRVAASIHEIRGGGAPISPGIARRILTRLRLVVRTEPALPPDRQGG
jgi:DNA-binding NarL/FixJ family response regulator